MMIKYLSPLSFFLFSLLFIVECTSVWSSSGVPSVKHQFLESPLVAEATCIGVTEEASAPYYRVEWQVVHIFKGHLVNTKLITRIPGGHIDGYNVYVPGCAAPRVPSVGERAVIFLSEPDKKGLRWVFGGNQGLLKVKRLQGKRVVILPGHTVSLKRFRQQLHEFRINTR